jgi:hypothetical protein
VLVDHVATRGLAQVEAELRRRPGRLETLRRLEGRSEVHACDQATSSFLDAYVAQLRAARDALERQAQPELVERARGQLFASEARMRAFLESYGLEAGRPLPPEPGTPRARRLDDLRTAATRLFEAKARLSEAPEALRAEAEVELEAVLAEVSEAHPILAGLAHGESELLESLTKFSAPVTLRRVLHERIDNARALRAELEASPERVWELAPVVGGWLHDQGIPPDDLRAVLARDLVREQVGWTASSRGYVTATALGMMAVGLAAGGPIGAGVAAAGLGLDAADFALFARGYGFHAAAGRVDIAPSRQLTGVATSRGELAFEAALAVAGAAGFLASDLRHLAGLRRSGAPRAAAFFEALARSEGDARAAAVHEVFRERGLLGRLEDLSEDAARWAAQHPARLGARLSDNADAVLAGPGPVGVDTLRRRLETLDRLPDGLQRSVDAQTLDALSAYPTGALRGIDAEGLAAFARAERALGAEAARALVTDLGFRNLAALEGKIDLSRLRPAGDGRVVLDDAMIIRGDALGRRAGTEAFAPITERLERFREARDATGISTPPVTETFLRDLDDVAGQIAGGKAIPDSRFRKLTKGIGVSNADARRIAEAMRRASVKLSQEAHDLARRAPELAPALRRLEAAPIPGPLKKKALDMMQRTLEAPAGTFDMRNIADTFHAALDPKRLRAAVEEVGHALRAVQKGDVKRGTKVWLGLKPGETVELAPGVKVSLPKIPPNASGYVTDIDVLYVARDDVVQTVEVKRGDRALMKAVNDRGAQYLDKLENWRLAGEQIGQVRRTDIAFVEPRTGALDQMTNHPKLGLLRTALEDRTIRVRENDW